MVVTNFIDAETLMQGEIHSLLCNRLGKFIHVKNKIMLSKFIIVKILMLVKFSIVKVLIL